MAKTQKNFRLDENTLRRLSELVEFRNNEIKETCERLGLIYRHEYTETELLTMLIFEEYKRKINEDEEI